MGDAYTKAGMALHMTFRSLRRLHRDHKIDHIVFAVDGGSWRYSVYAEYKSRRKLERLKLKPDEKEEQEYFYETLKNLVSYLHNKTKCTVLEHKGIEGDDFVARWIQLHQNDEHIIVSGDSDFVQLIAPNVNIFDGVQEHLISIDGIINAKGQRMEFSIRPKDGKIKVGNPSDNFVPEADWWKKALFVKIIRGDAGDGIFSAYPGVRYNGSAKREGILEAWEDRHDRGYHWNNFFQQEWNKLIEVDDTGNRVTRTVKVLDEYRLNQSLIDLTAQPDNIKETMDTAIRLAVTKPEIKNVGIHFLKFCGTHDLPALAKESADHSIYLNAEYRGDLKVS